MAKDKREEEALEIVRQKEFRSIAIDDDDSFIEEAPEDLEGGT